MSTPQISEIEKTLNSLKTRVENLASRFLDNQLTSETDPSFEIDKDAVAAFILLVHAEIEQWIEGRARASIKNLRELAKSQQPLRGMHHIMMLSIMVLDKVQIPIPCMLEDIAKVAGNTLDKCEELINKNNGIKSHGFGLLAMMCGIFPDELDADLLAQLNEYGKSRGEVAHKGAKTVRTLKAPSAEKQTALELIKALQLLRTP